jgi:lipopolysaccharide export system permease protein|tara:strand:+ start:2114 stop:3181 length:1068 start_codon:yes stop_codon:yes gene_type:complete
MRILDRLVIKNFLLLFCLFLLCAPPLFVLGDLAEHLDDYIDRGLSLGEVSMSYVYMYPLFIQWCFPIAALLGAVFTVHWMTTHREIVAAKAGGISFHRLVAPLLIAGILLTGVALALTEVVPRTNKISAQILRSEAPGRSWRSDFVYRSEEGISWQVNRLTASDGRMTDVVIERPVTDNRNGLHLIAEGARFQAEDGWILAQGFMRTLRGDSAETTIEFDRLLMDNLVERPEELLEVPPEPDEMTYAEINHMAAIIQRTGGNANELLVKREQKISIPVTTLIIILFGTPLATSSKRGGAAFGIGLSLATVLLFMMLLRVAGALGEAGAVSPLAAAWIPNMVFALTGLILMIRVRT